MEVYRRQLAAGILDIGEKLLEAGAEVNRVEDTMQRLGAAYGFDRVDAFTIISTINFSVTLGDETYTLTRRIKKISVNMEKIVRCNELSRRLCDSPEPVERLRESVKRLDEVKEYSFLQMLGIYVIVAASFTVFFGGDLGDSVSAGLAAIILRLIEVCFKRLNLHNFVLYFINSFMVGVVIYMLIGLGIGEAYDKIAMGNIMLLIPGIGLTTSIRDMLTGDMLSGVIGFLSAIIQAAAIALGFVAAAALLMVV